MKKFTNKIVKTKDVEIPSVSDFDYLEVHDEKVFGEIDIVSIIDVFNEPEKLVEAGMIGIQQDLSTKELKRGDTIFITALIRKKGQSMTSPATQAVLKVRIVDIFNGLSYLNKVLQ